MVVTHKGRGDEAKRCPAKHGRFVEEAGVIDS